MCIRFRGHRDTVSAPTVSQSAGRALILRRVFALRDAGCLPSSMDVIMLRF